MEERRGRVWGAPCVLHWCVLLVTLCFAQPGSSYWHVDSAAQSTLSRLVEMVGPDKDPVQQMSDSEKRHWHGDSKMPVEGILRRLRYPSVDLTVEVRLVGFQETISSTSTAWTSCSTSTPSVWIWRPSVFVLNHSTYWLGQ